MPASVERDGRRAIETRVNRTNVRVTTPERNPHRSPMWRIELGIDFSNMLDPDYDVSKVREDMVAMCVEGIDEALAIARQEIENHP